jgi:hypothetical protein
VSVPSAPRVRETRETSPKPRSRKSSHPGSKREKKTLIKSTTPVCAFPSPSSGLRSYNISSTRCSLCHTQNPANDISEDERSIGNRLAAAEEQNGDSNDTSGKTKSAETKAGEIDPTLPAKMHGNEPSRGAKIDKSIADDEEEIIRKMDEAKAQKKANK